MEYRGKEVKRLLPELDDREQWEVKIYADLRRWKDCLSQTRPETKEDELIQEGLNTKLNEYKQKSLGWMSKQALDARFNEIPPQKPNRRKKTLILESTFLVLKESRENFTGVVRCIRKEYKSKGLDFEYLGPKLPYDFL